MSTQTQTDKMLKTLLLHLGLYQVCDLWSAGENNGGRYVVLYNTRANYQLCKVYEEAFKKLPEFITSAIDDRIAAGDVPSEKNRAEKVGLLTACPPFAFTRWQIGGGQDEDKAKWRFGEVLWVKGGNAPAPTVHAEPEPEAVAVADEVRPAPTNGKIQPAPPVFDTRDDAVKWGMEMTGWDEEVVRSHMGGCWKSAGEPDRPVDFWPVWIAYIRERAKVPG